MTNLRYNEAENGISQFNEVLSIFEKWKLDSSVDFATPALYFLESLVGMIADETSKITYQKQIIQLQQMIMNSDEQNVLLMLEIVAVYTYVICKKENSNEH